jgi:hypothetical protein
VEQDQATETPFMAAAMECNQKPNIDRTGLNAGLNKE